MTSENEGNIEVNTTLEEEEGEDDVSTSKRARQRPKTASNTTGSGRTRRVSIMDSRKDKAGQHSTDSSEDLVNNGEAKKQPPHHRSRVRSASNMNDSGRCPGSPDLICF